MDFASINFPESNDIKYFAFTNFLDLRAKSRKSRKFIPAKVNIFQGMITFLPNKSEIQRSGKPSIKEDITSKSQQMNVGSNKEDRRHIKQQN